MSDNGTAPFSVTSAAVEEKRKLQKRFGRLDMFFFLICTLVGLDTIGAVANKEHRRSRGLQAKITQQTDDMTRAGSTAGLRLIASTYVGGPAHEIAEVARDVGADLVAVGARGQGPIPGLLLGSVTQRLLQIAPCSVLVARRGEALRTGHRHRDLGPHAVPHSGSGRDRHGEADADGDVHARFGVDEERPRPQASVAVAASTGPVTSPLG